MRIMRAILLWSASIVLVACGGAATPPATSTGASTGASSAAPEASAPVAPAATAEAGAATAGPKTFVHPDHPGLEITDVVVGDGAEVKAGDTIEVSYVGTLDDGSVFDEAKGAKFGIGVGMLIKGWDAGVPGMRVGGTRKLHVPASLAYGSKGAGSKVPPYAALNFTIQVTAVAK
jgi:FKBP-type peptidyl-prolyl cis-trans isomerase